MTDANRDGVWDAVYDVLVKHADAPENGRESFVALESAVHVSEYRFCGSLGFGGKFWRSGHRWYVTCYPRDRDPIVDAKIEATNAALGALRASL